MRKEALLAELDRNPALHEAIAEQLRKDTSDHLNQGHDFLQLVKLVRGHAEELLHRQFPDLPPHEAANKLATEGAIYFSTSLMLVKMDSLIFLNEVNRALGREVRFQIHPLVLKYVRIYRWQAEQKQLRIHLSGNCHGHSYYNNDAIGAVIQALLDNLVKYAPANSEASVTFHETEDSIVLSFDSLGPRIEPDELTKIFLPQYRAKAARLVELSGLGVGLATAKQISSALNLELDVHQEEIAAPTFPERFSTTFTLRLDRVT